MDINVQSKEEALSAINKLINEFGITRKENIEAHSSSIIGGGGGIIKIINVK